MGLVACSETLQNPHASSEATHVKAMHISAWREYELSKAARSDNGITVQQLRWLAALAGKTPENVQEAEAQQLATTALRKLQHARASPPGHLREQAGRSSILPSSASSATTGKPNVWTAPSASAYAYPAHGQYSRMPSSGSLTQQLHSTSGPSRLGVSHVLAAPSSPSHALLDELYPQRAVRAAAVGVVGGGSRWPGSGNQSGASQRRNIHSAQRGQRGEPTGSAASVASAPDRMVGTRARGGGARGRGGSALSAAVPQWLKHSAFAAGATHGLHAQGRPKLRTSHAAAAARSMAAGGGVGLAHTGSTMGIPSALYTGKARPSNVGAAGGAPKQFLSSTGGAEQRPGGGGAGSQPRGGARASRAATGGSEVMLNDTQRRLQLYTGGASTSNSDSPPQTRAPQVNVAR